MGALFWIKRFFMAAVPLFALLAVVEWYKGYATRDDYLTAAFWALVAATIFTVSSWRRYRSAQACALCDDLASARVGVGKKKKPQ